MKKSFLLGVITGVAGTTYIVKKTRLKDIIKRTLRK